MELYTLKRERLVPKAHDLLRAVLCPRRDDELSRDIGDDERMIPHNFDSLGKAAEHSFAVMLYLARLPVHRALCTHHFSAKILSDTLHAEAHPERRRASCGIEEDVLAY